MTEPTDEYGFPYAWKCDRCGTRESGVFVGGLCEDCYEKERAAKPTHSVFHPELRVVVEGMGGTVYIVTHDHDSQDKGKRGYIAEIGVGEDCWAKNQKEAMKIAYDLVDAYNEMARRRRA